MGHKHSKHEILEGALAAAFAEGMSQLTFGRLARRIGVSDRIIVYYFPNKDALIGGVLGLMGLRLREALDRAFAASAPPRDHLELVRIAWPVLTSPEIAPIFAVFLEVNGMATAGREPYRSTVRQFVHGWIGWAARLIGDEGQAGAAEAEAAIALIDGLLLLRHLSDDETGDRAARRLGVL